MSRIEIGFEPWDGTDCEASKANPIITRGWQERGSASIEKEWVWTEPKKRKR